MLPVTTNLPRSMMSTWPASSAVTHSSLPSGVAARRRGRKPTTTSRAIVAGVGVDRVHEIAGLGGDIDGLAVLADQHALRLGAGRHFLHDGVPIHVDDRERRTLFVGDVDAAALLVDGEGFRARAGLELADHLQLRHVENVDDVVVAAGDVEHAVIGVEMHVARPARDLDVLDHFVGLGIDDDDVVGLLVADENQPGILGLRAARRPAPRE